MTLCVDDAHLQRRGAQRQLPPDLPEPNDSELPLVKSDEAGDARPVAVGRMRALVARGHVACHAQLLLADAVCVLVELAGQREHEGKRLLSRRDIGAAPEGKNLDTGLFARRLVDARRGDAVLLDDPEHSTRRRDLSFTDGQGLDDDSAGISDISQQLRLVVDQPDFCWIKVLRL